MKQRVLVLGRSGRLGAALFRSLREEPGLEVGGLARPGFDLAKEVSGQLDAAGFDLIINAAAATNVDWCEDHPTEAERINGYAVGEIGELCRRTGTRCIHISTDYVFDGFQARPYQEDDSINPLSVYGRSKALGESLLLETSNDHLVIRVSWVFGPDKPSFIDFMLARARSEEQIEAVADKFSAPTYTLDFVEWIKPLLFAQPVSGRLHLCNQGACSWRELAQVALDSARRHGADLKASVVQPLELRNMKMFKAIRPVHTVFSTRRFTELTGKEPRPWPEAVDEYISRQQRRE